VVAYRVRYIKTLGKCRIRHRVVRDESGWVREEWYDEFLNIGFGNGVLHITKYNRFASEDRVLVTNYPNRWHLYFGCVLEDSCLELFLGKRFVDWYDVLREVSCGVV
jgi:hypothetical protein